MKKTEESKWLDYIIELQFIAQAGLAYSKDPFDIERFERLRDIAAEMLSDKTGEPLEFVRDVFCNEEGFQTPKLDCRAAIFEGDKILLVQERDERWSLPGGWVDVNQSIKENTIKEVKEEAGLDVEAEKFIAILDRNLHNTPRYAYGIAKSFIQCRVLGGTFKENTETLQSAYFKLDELPDLAMEKNTESQIKMCFDAYYDKNWKAIFD